MSAVLYFTELLFLFPGLYFCSKASQTIVVIVGLHFIVGATYSVKYVALKLGVKETTDLKRLLRTLTVPACPNRMINVNAML
jgi:hypothetical protein